MRYQDGLQVQKNISVSIKGGKKIIVVGLTSSWKSSLMSSLFHVTEVESDGIDISSISLNALRLNLSIIPQDLVMFCNTMCYNLDPFEEKSKYKLWEALKKVQLTKAITVMPGGLGKQVAEGGKNFSQG